MDDPLCSGTLLHMKCLVTVYRCCFLFYYTITKTPPRLYANSKLNSLSWNLSYKSDDVTSSLLYKVEQSERPWTIKSSNSTCTQAALMHDLFQHKNRHRSTSKWMVPKLFKVQHWSTRSHWTFFTYCRNTQFAYCLQKVCTSVHLLPIGSIRSIHKSMKVSAFALVNYELGDQVINDGWKGRMLD